MIGYEDLKKKKLLISESKSNQRLQARWSKGGRKVHRASEVKMREDSKEKANFSVFLLMYMPSIQTLAQMRSCHKCTDTHS